MVRQKLIKEEIYMTHSFRDWKDFNNISVKIYIKRKLFDAILVVDNNKLILKINMTKDLKEWRNTNKNYDILSGKFLFNEEKIFVQLSVPYMFTMSLKTLVSRDTI